MKIGQLNRLYWLKKEITQVEEQIKELSVLPVQSSASASVEQFTEQLLILREKLNKKLTEYVQERIAIEDIINYIDEPEVRIIARKRFIENKSWETIGEEMYMDRTTAYKKLKRYVKNNL